MCKVILKSNEASRSYSLEKNCACNKTRSTDSVNYGKRVMVVANKTHCHVMMIMLFLHQSRRDKIAVRTNVSYEKNKGKSSPNNKVRVMVYVRNTFSH